MVDRADLDAAAEAGVITPGQIAPLYDFLAARREGAAAKPALSGEEDLRFIRNFHDVFLAVGIALLSIGLIVATATFASEAENFRAGALRVAACCAGSAALIWALGEFFARRRRLFLPAIAICVSFTGFATATAFAIYTMALGEGSQHFSFTDQQGLDATPWLVRQLPLIAMGAGALAAGAFYLRFRLPFSMGVLGSFVAFFLAAMSFAAAPQFTFDHAGMIMLALGVFLFLAGVWFDARDPARATRLSDNGFWLHLAAAPLILNGALGLVDAANTLQEYQMAQFHVFSEQAPGADQIAEAKALAVTRSLITLVIVAALGLISLLINRRALIVSALVTTGIAIGLLMNATGLGVGALIAGTLVTLGGFVLIIGASWHVMRRGLLGWVKPGGGWARVFPPEAPA